MSYCIFTFANFLPTSEDILELINEVYEYEHNSIDIENFPKLNALYTSRDFHSERVMINSYVANLYSSGCGTKIIGVNFRSSHLFLRLFKCLCVLWIVSMQLFLWMHQKI